MNNFKKIASFKLPPEIWVITPFVEPFKKDESVFFTDAEVFSTPEEEEFILIAKTLTAEKIVGLQAFFVIKKEKIGGFAPNFSIKEAPFNVFKSGWRCEKAEEIKDLKEKFFGFMDKQLMLL